MDRAFRAAMLALAAIIAVANQGWVAGYDGGGFVATRAVAADLDRQSNATVVRPGNARADLHARWLEDGYYRFPPDHGFATPPQETMLAPGAIIDRYGQPGGHYLAPAGTPFEARALPYDPAKLDYYRYEVLKPLPVKAGTAAPWFDQPGGGVQYVTAISVQQLIDQGYLREVK